MTIIWQWHESDPGASTLAHHEPRFDQCWFWRADDDDPPEWMPHLWRLADEWDEMRSYGDTCVMRYYPAPQEEPTP